MEERRSYRKCRAASFGAYPAFLLHYMDLLEFNFLPVQSPLPELCGSGQQQV